jgi:hypothetical protein
VGRAACPQCASHLNIVKATKVATRSVDPFATTPAACLPDSTATHAAQALHAPAQLAAQVASTPQRRGFNSPAIHSSPDPVAFKAYTTPVSKPVAIPASPTKKAKPEEEESLRSAPPLWMALSAVLLISAAPVCAGISRAVFLALPLCMAGLALGTLCLLFALRAREGVKTPSASTAYGLLVLVLLFFWPAAMGPTYYAYRQPTPRGDVTQIALKSGQVAGVIPKSADWVDASQFNLTRNGIQTEIVRATVGRIEVRQRDGSRQLTKDPVLVIWIRRQHTGDPAEYASKIRERDHGMDSAMRCRATDETGVEFAQQNFDLSSEGSNMPMRATGFSVSMSDGAVVFAAPPRTIAELRLEVWAPELGSAPLRFTIPNAMISWPDRR